MDGGEEALKTAGISYVQPNWFSDGDWCYLHSRLRGYFCIIWTISKGSRLNSVFRDKYTSVFGYICLYGQLNVSSYLCADTCMYIDIWRYICQYAYNSQAIQIWWCIYNYMSIYAYVDIYVSIQLTVYLSVCSHIWQYAYSSQVIQICSRIYKYLYTRIYWHICIYTAHSVLKCILPYMAVCF
jgi:hypothetical protein